MDDALNRMKNILIALIILWFAIIGIFGAVAAFALPVFYIITLIKKKQIAYSTAIYTLSIISILVLVFLLIGFGYGMFEPVVSGSIAVEYHKQLPIIIDIVLMVVSLVLNIKLVKYSGAVRKEMWIASGWQPSSPDNIYGKKPTHVASLVIGIVSIVSFFGFVFIGIPCVVCGTIGIVFSYRVRADYNSSKGMILSVIGLTIGLCWIFVILHTTLTNPN